MFRRIGKILLSGSPDRRCEDRVVTRNHEEQGVFAVIDGVSGLVGSMNGFPIGDVHGTGGEWAAVQIQDFLLNHLDLRVRDALSLVEKADRHLKVAMGKLGFLPTSMDDAWRLPGAAACIAHVDEGRNHFSMAQVGDCLGVVELESGERRLFGDPLLTLDSAVHQAIGKHGGIESEKVQSLLWKNRRKRNRELYAVLDGNLNKRLVATISVPLAEVRRFALLTDGLFFLNSDLPKVADAILDSGLDEWREYIVACEEADPTCSKHTRVKPGDDKAGIVFEREES